MTDMQVGLICGCILFASSDRVTSRWGFGLIIVTVVMDLLGMTL